MLTTLNHAAGLTHSQCFDDDDGLTLSPHKWYIVPHGSRHKLISADERKEPSAWNLSSCPSGGINSISSEQVNFSSINLRPRWMDHKFDAGLPLARMVQLRVLGGGKQHPRDDSSSMLIISTCLFSSTGSLTVGWQWETNWYNEYDYGYNLWVACTRPLATMRLFECMCVCVFVRCPHGAFPCAVSVVALLLSNVLWLHAWAWQKNNDSSAWMRKRQWKESVWGRRQWTRRNHNESL